ncbi:MAG: type II secretion system F family protein [Planctomycetaceae bacterium]
MQLNPIVISIAAFVGVVGLIAAVYFLIRDKSSSSLEDRLDILAGKKSAKAEENNSVTKEDLLAEGLSGITGFAQSVSEKFGNLKLLFEQSDSSMKSEQFFLYSAVAGIIGAVVAMLLRLPAPLYPVFGLMFSGLPLMFLLFKRGRRFKKFAKQLPDALELIARALRSGHSLASGINVVVDEMPEPISKEFGMSYEEQNLGVPLDQSLKNMYNRMPNLDLKFFVTAVVIQRQAGGDLAEILDKIGKIVRERFKIQGQVQALTGEGRISGIVLMALPICLFFAVWRLNPDYMMLLFDDPIGKQMIAGAAFLQVLGAISIKKIIAIKI